MLRGTTRIPDKAGTYGPWHIRLPKDSLYTHITAALTRPDVPAY